VFWNATFVEEGGATSRLIFVSSRAEGWAVGGSCSESDCNAAGFCVWDPTSALWNRVLVWSNFISSGLSSLRGTDTGLFGGRFRGANSSSSIESKRSLVASRFVFFSSNRCLRPATNRRDFSSGEIVCRGASSPDGLVVLCFGSCRAASCAEDSDPDWFAIDWTRSLLPFRSAQSKALSPVLSRRNGFAPRLSKNGTRWYCPVTMAKTIGVWPPLLGVLTSAPPSTIVLTAFASPELTACCNEVSSELTVEVPVINGGRWEHSKSEWRSMLQESQSSHRFRKVLRHRRLGFWPALHNNSVRVRRYG